MKRIAILLIIITLSFLQSCKKENTVELEKLKAKGVEVLNLEDIHNNDISVKDFFEKPSYIKLESDDVLIGEIKKVIVKNDSIYIMESSNSQEAIFVFNMDGKFLYKIDHRGNGPGEYQSIFDFYVDSNRKQIGLLSLEDLYTFDFNGTFQKKTTLGDFYFTRIAYNQDNIYGYSYDTDKAIKVENLEGQLINEYFHENKDLRESSLRGWDVCSLFTSNNKVYFSTFYNDTIYSLDKKGMRKEFVVNFGDSKFPKKEMDELLKLPADIEFLKKVNEAKNSSYIAFGVSDIFMNSDILYFRVLKSANFHNIFYSLKTGNIQYFNNNYLKDTDFLVLGKVIATDKDNFYYLPDTEKILQIKQDLEKIPYEKIEKEFSKGQLEFYNNYIKDYKIDDNPIIIKTKIKDF